jgi:hypothetical protein
MALSSRHPDVPKNAFLMIGAMKSGTTSLFEAIVSHPQVHEPTVKEPEDLTSDAVLSEPGFSRYLKIFSGAPEGAWCGEASTAYTKLPEYSGAAERAKIIFGPDVKLVFIGRDPVSRLRSHYRHEVAKGTLSGSLAEALVRFPALRDVSRYDRQLAPWRKTFGDKALLVLQYSDYVANPRAVVERVWAHLGLDPAGLDAGAHRNASAGKRVPKGIVRSFVQSDFYARGIRTLLPYGLRQRVKALLVPKGQKQFADTLSPDAEATLRAELSAACRDFEALASRSAGD